MSQLTNITDSAGAVIKGADNVVNWLKNQQRQIEKAMNTSVRVEGFRLKGVLSKEIRAGAPGGRVFAPLSYIARRLNKQVKIMGGATQRNSPNRKPLARLVNAVRYRVTKENPFTMEVGFVDPNRGSNVLSKAWRRITAGHQEGFTRDISQRQREYMALRGGSLGRVEGGSTPFFLRKSTRTFHTLARPIINPFWAAHRDEAGRNIRKNFAAKLQGNRI